MILGMLSIPSYACLNSYDELSSTYRDDLQHFKNKNDRNYFYRNKLKEFVKKHPQPKSVEEKNDYAVQLIYNYEYSKAINILLDIEKIKPNLAKTAVNLGTAYELNGDLDKAEFWISKGIKLDSTIHHGSEWIHLNILKAKKNNETLKWYEDHPLLGFRYGHGYSPIEVNKGDRWDKVRDISGQGRLQLSERRKFIYGEDYSVARLAYELSNLEEIYAQSDELKYRLGYPNVNSKVFMDIALYHGLEQGKTEIKRIKYLGSDSFIYRFILMVIDYISGIFPKGR